MLHCGIAEIHQLAAVMPAGDGISVLVLCEYPRVKRALEIIAVLTDHGARIGDHKVKPPTAIFGYFSRAVAVPALIPFEVVEILRPIVIEYDTVQWEVFFVQRFDDLINLVPAPIGAFALNVAQRPQRRKRRLSREVGILAENVRKAVAAEEILNEASALRTPEILIIFIYCKCITKLPKKQ